MLVINNTPLKNVRDIELSVDVSGNRLLSFTSVLKNSEIKEEAIVELDGYEYRIKQLIETSYTQEVVAPSTFFDLVNVQKHEIFGGTKRISEFLNWLSTGTGWTFIFNGNDKSILMPNFGNDNVIKLINELIGSADIEYKIDRNKTVVFDDMIGPDNDYQYRYNHNIKTLNRHVDTTQLKTVITGYGKDNLKITYTSPNVSKFGRLEAEAIRDERFTNSSSLTEYIKGKLNDTPDVSIELDVYELKDKEIGERIWLIYEPLDIEMQTRVMALNYKYINDNFIVTSVVLGNEELKSQTDILSEQIIEIDNDNKQMQSRIEQTNDRITLEVEELDRSVSRLELRSDRIELSVSNLENDVNSSISILQNEINLKVNKNGVISAINISPESIDIDANKINFNGKVFGNSDAQFMGKVQAERIIGNEISGVTVRTSNASRYVHLENQELVLKDGNLKKLQIGFIDNNGISHNTPYIIMGQGRDNNRDRLVMEKLTNLFEMKYLAQNGDSSVRMNYDGNLSINAVRTIYLNGNAVSSNATITAPDFNPSSTVKIKSNIKKHTDNAMDIINRINVYDYRLKEDLAKGIYDNKQLGFLAEAATEIKSGDAISLYKAVAYMWKALQEKDKEINELKLKLDDIINII